MSWVRRPILVAALDTVMVMEPPRMMISPTKVSLEERVLASRHSSWWSMYDLHDSIVVSCGS